MPRSTIDVALITEHLPHPTTDRLHPSVEVLIRVPRALLGHRSGDGDDDDPRGACALDRRIHRCVGRRDQHDRVRTRLDDVVEGLNVRLHRVLSHDNLNVDFALERCQLGRQDGKLLHLWSPVVADEVVADDEGKGLVRCGLPRCSKCKSENRSERHDGHCCEAHTPAARTPSTTRTAHLLPPLAALCGIVPTEDVSHASGEMSSSSRHDPEQGVHDHRGPLHVPPAREPHLPNPPATLESAQRS